MSNVVIGHTHITEVPASPTNASELTSNFSSALPGHGLHVVIAPTTARVPSSVTTPSTPGHGHEGRFTVPHTEAVLSSTDRTPSTPGHGHPARFVFPPPGSDSTSTPVQPRPSARVARRSSLFTTTDEGHNEGAEETGNAALGHPLFDVARNGALPPTMEAEEPPSAEVGGHFDQPTRNQEDGLGGEADASRSLGGA